MLSTITVSSFYQKIKIKNTTVVFCVGPRVSMAGCFGWFGLSLFWGDFFFVWLVFDGVMFLYLFVY